MRRVLVSMAIGLLLTVASRTQTATFDLAIRRVRVVHGDGRVTPRATVFVASGRIARIDTSPAADGVPARRSIAADGRTLIPGLIDAHVHVEPWALPLFLKYGVTAVRDVHNAADAIVALARDEAPTRPRIVAAGAMLDGAGSFWNNAVVVSDIASVRAAVRAQVEAGAGVVKVGTRLSSSTIAVVVQEARARGLPVAAHLGRATATQAAAAGVTSIEHLSGVAEAASDDPIALTRGHADFFSGWAASELEWPRLRPAALEQIARTLVERGVVIVPTLSLHEAWSRLAGSGLSSDPAFADVPSEVAKSWAPDAFLAKTRWAASTVSQFAAAMPVMQRFLKLYLQLGGRAAAGTDSVHEFVVPGASLHRELELAVAAGLTPAQALKTATVDAADLLGIGGRVGSIDTGKDADLILVDGDPLSDIRNTRRIVNVVRMGVVAR